MWQGQQSFKPDLQHLTSASPFGQGAALSISHALPCAINQEGQMRQSTTAAGSMAAFDRDARFAACPPMRSSSFPRSSTALERLDTSAPWQSSQAQQGFACSGLHVQSLVTSSASQHYQGLPTRGRQLPVPEVHMTVATSTPHSTTTPPMHPACGWKATAAQPHAVPAADCWNARVPQQPHARQCPQPAEDMPHFTPTPCLSEACSATTQCPQPVEEMPWVAPAPCLLEACSASTRCPQPAEDTPYVAPTPRLSEACRATTQCPPPAEDVPGVAPASCMSEACSATPPDSAFAGQASQHGLLCQALAWQTTKFGLERVQGKFCESDWLQSSQPHHWGKTDSKDPREPGNSAALTSKTTRQVSRRSSTPYCPLSFCCAFLS
eukprot:TRINITY_DN91497_c0_g1_i1.p1 TRINITY_DN91497_c0_g1~~TRINITY_DN91497_c0_g1_i1.p1  ORF type:complete len:392 (-),score=60.03 TRINITY_DN91497_c0_g1_i1:405-1544(-)